MAGKIFINYRRDDSISTAGRLYDRLAQTFGRNNLFMDVDHIPAGVDFVEYLNSQVAACDVFLAVIGPNWLDAQDDDGRRRFDNPDDFVTIEIAAALARKIRVIPVLVDGARTPKADKLPDAVKPLARRNAVEIRNTQFGRDAEALTHKVREALKDAPAVPRRWPFVASAAARLMAPGRWRTVAGSATALLLVGWIGLYQMGVPVWAPWTPRAEQPDAPGADKAKAAAEAEARRKAAEAEQQRLKEEEQRQAKAADDADAKRKAAEVEQQRLKEEEQRQAKAAADADAKRKAAEAEQQRLAAIKEEEQRQAKAADFEAKLKAAEAEQQRLKEEVQRQAKAAADAEAKRKAAEAEQQRLKEEIQRQAKAAADAEAKRKAAEAEQQRLAVVKAEEERKAKSEADTAAKYAPLPQSEKYAAPFTVLSPLTVKLQDTFLATDTSTRDSLNDVTRALTTLSDGKLKIELLAAGSIAPAFQVLDAVHTGALDAAWTMPAYWYGVSRAFALTSGIVPMGLDAASFVRWIEAEGAAESNRLIVEVAKKNVRSIPCGLQGPGGEWFKKPVRQIDDFRGLKFRTVGLPIEVAKELGAAVIVLPGGEIVPAMEKGLIDASDWTTPASAIQLGLANLAKNLQYPGLTRPVHLLELLIGDNAWRKLGSSGQAGVQAVCRQNLHRNLDAIPALERQGLDEARRRGVTVQPYPPAMLNAARQASQRVLENFARQDPDFAKVLASYNKYR